MIIIAIAPAITIPAIPPGERADPGCCVAELDVMADVVGTDELVMGTDELVVDVLVDMLVDMLGAMVVAMVVAVLNVVLPTPSQSEPSKQRAVAFPSLAANTALTPSKYAKRRKIGREV
jgi:hypothetical protein